MALSDFQTHTIQQLIQRYIALSAAKFAWLFVVNWSSKLVDFRHHPITAHIFCWSYVCGMDTGRHSVIHASRNSD